MRALSIVVVYLGNHMAKVIAGAPMVVVDGAIYYDVRCSYCPAIPVVVIPAIMRRWKIA
jgi:hypothetical protein